MKKLIFLIPMLVILLASNINAATFASVGFKDSDANIKTITEGQSVTIWANGTSNAGSFTVQHVTVRDGNDNLVKTLESNLNVDGNNFYKEYTISGLTAGSYTIYTAVKDPNGPSDVDTVDLIVTPASGNGGNGGNGEQPPKGFATYGDLNFDGKVNYDDFLVFADAFNGRPGRANWNPDADFNGDNVVNMNDYLELIRNWGKTTNFTLRFYNRNSNEQISNLIINENEAFNVDAVLKDLNGNILPISVESNIPLNKINTQFNGITDYNTVQHPKTSETFGITVKGNVQGINVQRTFNLRVNDVNRLPELSQNEINVKEGFNVGGSVFNPFRGNRVVVSINDADNDNVQISANNLPVNSKIENNQFIWDIRKNQGRSQDYVVTFSLNDGITSVNKELKINVEDNILTSSVESPTATIGLASIEKLSSNDVEVTVSAVNSNDNQDYQNELEFRYDFDNDGNFDTEWKKDLEFSKSNVRHTYNKDLKEANIKLQVRDLDGNVSEDVLKVDLEALGFVPQPPGQPPVTQNQAPVVSNIPDQTATSGVNFNTINLDNLVTDDSTPDNQIVWSVSGTSQLSVNIVNRVATISYPAGFLGIETLTFTARDIQGLSASDNAVFTINAVQPPNIVNQNPVLNVLRNSVVVSQVTLNEGEALTLVLQGSDSDNDALRYSGLNMPSGSTLNGNVFSWTPTNTQGDNTNSVVFTVIDLDANGQAKGGSDSETVTIVVNDNLSPKSKKTINHVEIGSIVVNGWQTVQRGESFDINVLVNNKGNVEQKDVKVTIDIPQLDNYQVSGEFNVKKRKTEDVSFNVEIPSDFSDDQIYMVVTAGNNKDKDSEVMAFLVE